MAIDAAPIQSAPAKPATIKWLVGITWFRLGAALLTVLLAIVFEWHFQSAWLEAFRSGWIKAAGFDPQDFGAYQSGAVMGTVFIPAVGSALILTFVNKRKRTALRVTACVLLFLGLGQPITIPLALVVTILSFRPSASQYLAPAPAAQPVA